MAQVGLTLDFTGYTGDLIVVWYKNTAPLTEIGRSAALPFPVSETITAANLTDESYTFKFYQSADGISLDTLLRTWSIDASAYGSAVVTRYEYIVGRGSSGSNPTWADPVQDDTQIIDERLAGIAKEDIEVVMRGTGPRGDDEWNLVSGGGIELNVTGEVFNDGDRIFVSVARSVSNSSAPASTSGEYTDIVTVSADDTVDSDYNNKIIVCTGASPVTTLTFPAFNTIADCKIKFTTHAMTGNYLALQFFAGNTVSLFGNKNLIHLAQGETLEIIFKTNVGYVAFYEGSMKHRGDFELSNKNTKAGRIIADGTEVDIADYQGLYNALTTEQKVTYAAWNLFNDKSIEGNTYRYYYNRIGKFAVDTSAGTMKLPNPQGYVFRVYNTGETEQVNASTGGDTGVGGIWSQQLLKHKHGYKRTRTDIVGSQYESNHMDSGSGRGLYTGDDVNTVEEGENKAAVDSIAQYCLIIL
jgi:hypothetical protein